MTDPTLIDQLKGLATGIATEVATKYAKPSGGIPSSDLVTAVQTSLGKADSALQTAPVTSVNGYYGAVNLSASNVGAYAKPSNGIPNTDLASGVQAALINANTAPQIDDARTKTSTVWSSSKIASDYVSDDELASALAALTYYTKPSGGIPDTDLDSGVQTSLGKADTALQTAPVTSVNAKSGAVNLTASDVGAAPTGAYVKPGAGVPSTDMTSAVQTSLGKADSALQTATNWYVIPGKPFVVAEGTSESAARTSIGAGTSNLALGTTGATAKAGNYQPTAANISDATTVGRELLTTATVATAQSILGISALPDIQTKSYAAASTITATSFAQVPNLASILFSTPAPLLVEVSFSAWLSATGNGDLRAGIAISGAYGTEAPIEPSWGSVMYLPGSYGSTMREETVKRVIIPQGSTVFTPQAYVTGSGTKGVNYGVFQVIPIRWA